MNRTNRYVLPGKLQIASNSPAFTLVELLVVAAIIGILATLLIPSLGRAKQLALSDKCQSNLHGLITGWQLYASTFNGTVMPSRDYTDTKYYKFWNGWQDKSFAADDLRGFDAAKGFLWKFMGGKGMSACPCWDGKPNNGQLGYGYNWTYFSYYDGNPDGSGKRTFDWTNIDWIKRPSEKVAFADCGRPIKTKVSQIETTPFLDAPIQQYPSFHARHSGRGNVAWADGHVSNDERPVWLHYPNYIYGSCVIPVDVLKKNNIGDIDRDNDPTTDEMFTLE